MNMSGKENRISRKTRESALHVQKHVVKENNTGDRYELESVSAARGAFLRSAVLAAF